ncbi:2,4-dienoyl-CoA reductase [Sphingobium faniae]|nr:2,4-dienoyl-CoA reductase [Sphingobium faniae]
MPLAMQARIFWHHRIEGMTEMSDHIEAFFAPFEYKALKLRNRVAMSPMTRYFSPDGLANEDVAAYYQRRAEGGAGLIISEGIFPDREIARNQENIPWFDGERRTPWQKVIDDVHAAGARMAPQIWHVGGARDFNFPESPLGDELESPSGLYGPDMAGGREMTEEDIADVAASFARAAKEMQAMGFDAIEFHGGHGYIFDQYFWTATNKRSDRYGGATIGERTRFATEVIRATREAVGEDFVLFFRLSQWKTNAYDARIADSPAELEQWVCPLVDAGVDIFDCSQRRFWETEFAGSDLNLAGWVKKLTGQPTMTVGSIGLATDLMKDFETGALSAPTPSTIEQVAERLDRGEFDLVAVGRAMLADAQWSNKVRDRRFHELKGYSVELMKTLV